MDSSHSGAGTASTKRKRQKQLQEQRVGGQMTTFLGPYTTCWMLARLPHFLTEVHLRRFCSPVGERRPGRWAATQSVVFPIPLSPCRCCRHWQCA